MKKLALALTLVFLLSALVAGCGLIARSATGAAIDVVAQASEEPQPELQPFQLVPGTAVLKAPVTLDEWTPTNTRSSGGSQVRNILFLNAETLAATPLFPTNDQTILRTVNYPQKGLLDGEEELPEEPRWVLYYIVKADSDGDGRLTHDDAQTLALTNPDGSNYHEFLDAVTRFHTVTMTGDEHLLVVYEKAATLHVARLDLPNRVIEMSQEIAVPGLGGEE